MRLLAFFAGIFLSLSSFGQSTLDSVRSKGFLQCGVNTGLAGFSQPDSKGVWRGIDVDLCRAVAAAVLGDAAKVRYTPLTAQQRFTALQSGEVDILSRNTTWTITRDTSLGLNFVGVNYYDGQGFMVPRKLNVKSAKQLNGATVCVQPGTTTELNLADYFRANRMTFKPVVIEKLEEVLNATQPDIDWTKPLLRTESRVDCAKALPANISRKTNLMSFPPGGSPAPA